ncbi:MAG TPA: plasmid stabilization protein ParE [Oceanospirillales bacterium]|nr:plasmid stabilization protein ParE [Oceanospirillaceae bacterium]HBS42379.1 plasmid stabilization protein ParE [Oceanospirillales bacterium]|tara:strand:- start:1623 stop:1901 length:279 start_codon:yes stop_codon:yes gene_type:complete
MTCHLSTEAAQDILNIFLYGVAEYGEAKAIECHATLKSVFAFLSDNPKAASLRTEFNLPVRIHTVGAHIVVYEEDNAGIFILRVRHTHEDWT